MSISDINPTAYTKDGTEYCTIPGAVTPVGTLNVYMKVGGMDYLDHEGKLHEEPTPEGFHKAEYALWNVSKEKLAEYVQGLPGDGIFKIAGTTYVQRAV